MANLEIKVEDKKMDESVVTELTSSKEVTDAKIEKSLNYDELTEAEKKAVDEFNSKIDIYDSTQILQFGSAAQDKISRFSDTVLENVKTKQTGDAGDLLAELVAEIKTFDSVVTPPKTGISKLFYSAKKEFNKILASYGKVEKNIDTIEGGLEKNKIQLLTDVNMFDTMYEKNLEYFKEVSLYIIAGERKLKELREEVLPELKKKAKESGDQIDAQKVNDLEAQINRFEKKIYDLKTTRIISIQMAPQIRMIQNNDSELVEKIQSSITNTIPLWKNQVVIALGLANAKSALNTQQAVTEITNEMLKKNSENLKQGTIEIAAESEKAIVDVETLKKTNSDIIETLDTIIKIHEEGAQKRSEAEVELQKIEQELKEKLLQIKEEKENA